MRRIVFVFSLYSFVSTITQAQQNDLLSTAGASIGLVGSGKDVTTITESGFVLDHPLIEFVGDITDAEKSDFIGNAIGLVCPYDWPEPFGLVLIESLACGTPVLAYRRGSIPEIIGHGVTGFISENLDEMVSQVSKLGTIDRHRCRKVFDERFTAQRMTHDYVKIYQQLIAMPPRSRARRGRSTPRTSSHRDINLAEGPVWQTSRRPLLKPM